MSGSKTHFAVGSLIGAGLYALARKNQNQPVDLNSIVGVGLLGGFVGLLPDILEPADSPTHRRFAHSITALVGLAHGINTLNENPNLENEQKELWTILALCYGSHLAMDSQTPAGLPLI